MSHNDFSEPANETKDDIDINNELKEFVKQRYARRYRSKFPRRKSSNLIDEVILEEDETQLAEAEAEQCYSIINPESPQENTENAKILNTDQSSDDSKTETQSGNSETKSNIEKTVDTKTETELNEANMNMVLRLKRKKGVTFSAEPAKSILPNNAHCKF